MSEYLDRLFDEYRRAVKEGQDLMDLAGTEKRDLTPEEQEHVDKAFEGAQARKAEIDKVKRFEELRDSADVFRSTAAPVIERATGKAPSDAEMFRAMFRGDGGYDSNITRQLSGAPEIELRALQSAGGSAIETSFADFVTVYQRTFTPMLRPDVVRILARTDGSPIVLPRLTADSSTGGTLVAEAGGLAEVDPTISSVQLNPYKFGAVNLWSSELAQDNTIGLESLIAETTGRDLAISIGTVLTTGDGSSKPQGFIGVASNGGTASGTGTTYGTYFGYTDLVDLFYGRAAPYRSVGTWMANSTSLAQIRKQRSTTGEPAWEPSPALGQPETLLGRPIYENPGMANGSAAKAVAFGDFSRFIVARVLPIRVESSIHYKFSTDQVALRTIERIDSDLVDTAAVAYLVNAAV